MSREEVKTLAYVPLISGYTYQPSSFYVEWRATGTETWRATSREYSYGGERNAILCANAKYRNGRDVRVIRAGVVIYERYHDNENTTGGDEMDPISNLPKPLNVKRVDVISALQKRADEEEAKRKEESERIESLKKDAKEAIAKFTPDEMYAIFNSYFTTEAEDLVRYQEQKRFVPEESKPTKVETDIERAVRVLNMSPDETIELRPDSDIYKLL